MSKNMYVATASNQQMNDTFVRYEILNDTNAHEYTVRFPEVPETGYIDLRSDTPTKPTPKMRKLMAEVEVEDSEYDCPLVACPIVARSEAMAAEITGKEAALFVSSGCQGNLLSVMVSTNRGDAIILHQNSHISILERGGYSVVAGVVARMVTSTDDEISGNNIKAAVRTPNLYYPETKYVAFEQPKNNGTIVPPEKMAEAYKVAKGLELWVHLDGARIFNAATALGIDAKEITQYADSVMFCVSKGLCSPIGSFLCGDKKFIAKARKFRKLLGGSMRQTGILAACAIVSMEEMIGRLHEDHDNATYLAKSLADIPGVEIDLGTVQTNMVFFKVNDIDHDAFVQHLRDNKIRILDRNPDNDNRYRMVMHNDISRGNVDHILEVIENYLLG